MTVGELEARMSNREFIRWQVYLGRKRQREEAAEQKARSKR